MHCWYILPLSLPLSLLLPCLPPPPPLSLSLSLCLSPSLPPLSLSLLPSFPPLSLYLPPFLTPSLFHHLAITSIPSSSIYLLTSGQLINASICHTSNKYHHTLRLAANSLLLMLCVPNTPGTLQRHQHKHTHTHNTRMHTYGPTDALTHPHAYKLTHTHTYILTHTHTLTCRRQQIFDHVAFVLACPLAHLKLALFV